MSTENGAGRRCGKRWLIVAVLLSFGAIAGMAWRHSHKEVEFHPGNLIGTERSGRTWAITLADWTSIQLFQDCFVDRTEAELTLPSCNDDDLRLLEHFRMFASLSINGASVTDEGLRRFANVEHLETLRLANVAISPYGLENLDRMPQLKILKLSGEFVTDAYLLQLHDVQTLESIELIETNTTQDGRDDLAQSLPACRITISEKGLDRAAAD